VTDIMKLLSNKYECTIDQELTHALSYAHGTDDGRCIIVMWQHSSFLLEMKLSAILKL